MKFIKSIFYSSFTAIVFFVPFIVAGLWNGFKRYIEFVNDVWNEDPYSISIF